MCVRKVAPFEGIETLSERAVDSLRLYESGRLPALRGLRQPE